MTKNPDQIEPEISHEAINEKTKRVWKKLNALLQTVPLDQRIARWKKTYRGVLIRQLRLAKDHQGQIRIWHIVAWSTCDVAETVPAYSVSEEFAKMLVEATTTDASAYELACELLAANLENGTEAPATLRVFGAQVLSGNAQKPTQAHRPLANWYRDYLIIEAIELARLMGINPTRNEATDVECGISIVQEAVAEVWDNELSFERVRKIWTNREKLQPSPSRLQSAIDILLQNPEN